MERYIGRQTVVVVVVVVLFVVVVTLDTFASLESLDDPFV